MGRVITRERQSYIVLSIERALLYAEFDGDDSFRLTREPDYLIGKVASKGVKAQGYFRNIYKGEGQLLFSVSPGFYRGQINPNETHVARKGLEKHLGETYDINPSPESISDVAQEIRGQLPEAHKDNPYALTEGIVHWIKDNIEYIIVPKSLINHVGKTVNQLSGEDRTDAYIILRHSFNVKDDILRRVADDVYLSPFLREASDYEIAKELMSQVNDVWGFLQWWWVGNEESSAQKTLEEKAGKCTGISNLFVALSRNLGIPSRKIDGYAGDSNGIFGGCHAWAVSNMQPYGWIEIDPTMHQFGNFDFDTHAYDLSMDHENLPRFTVIEKGNGIPTGKIDDVVKLLEEDKNWFDRSFRRKKHRSEIDFLQSLRGE